MVQHIGQKAVYLPRRGAARALMGPRKASPLRSRKASPSLSPGCGVGSEGWVPAPLVFFSPPWKPLPPDHKAAETRANEPPPRFPFDLLPSHAERAPSSPALGPSPACCWLFCFLGAAAVPLLPVTGQRAELGQLERPPPGSHPQPGPVTVVPHGPRNLCFWLQGR